MINQNVAIDTGQVKRFFNTLWPNQDSGFLSVSCNGQSGLVSKHFPFPLVDTAYDAISRWADRNVWYTIGALGQRPEKRRGTADEVMAAPALVVDIDCKSGIHKQQNLPTREEALAFLNAIPFKPSLLVWSGGGFQAYWILKEAWAFDTPEEREQAKKLFTRWQSYLLSEGQKHGWKLDNCGSIEHLFRVPGTFNHKAAPVPVEIVQDNGFRYSVDAIRDFLDDIGQASCDRQSEAGSHDGKGSGRISEIVDKCAFLSHCRDDAASLTEIEWWCMVCALVFEGGSKGAIHELSKGYAGYKSAETDKKILEALKQSGPMTCQAIREKTGFGCPSGGCGVKCPVHLLNGNFKGTHRVEWEEPIPLDDSVLPLMQPISGILGEISQAVAQSTETPLELPLSMALATIATACQRKIIVQVKPGYVEPVNLYLNVALDSGSRKSSVHAQMTKPLLIWESAKKAEMEPVVRNLESIRRNQEARIKCLRTRYGKAKQEDLESLEIEIGQLERDLAEPPSLPRIWVQDVTPEQLGVEMGRHGEKMSVLSAEGGIFDIVAGRYSNGVPNIDLLLQGHSGDPVRVDRGSRDPVYLEHPAITMGLSTQPEVLRRIADVPGFRGRGFLARFLYLLPRSTLGTRSLETQAVSEALLAEYYRVVHALLNIEPTRDKNGKQAPFTLHLGKEAYREWLEFSRAVEVELREGGRYEHITDWAGKLPGAAIRLAGLLHCVKHYGQPWSREIGFETMGEALELTAVFSVHALRVFDLMGADKALQGARRVWRWVERTRSEVFTKRECFNALKGTFPRVDDIAAPLGVLEERSYIGSLKELTGGRPTVRYSVNPLIRGRWMS